MDRIDEIRARWFPAPGAQRYWVETSEDQEADVLWLIEEIERLRDELRESREAQARWTDSLRAIELRLSEMRRMV